MNVRRLISVPGTLSGWRSGDSGRLKARLKPICGLEADRIPGVVIQGHALMQDIRGGHYQFNYDTDPNRRAEAALDELRPMLEP